jgi:hypothetical protein
MIHKLALIHLRDIGSVFTLAFFGFFFSEPAFANCPRSFGPDLAVFRGIGMPDQQVPLFVLQSPHREVAESFLKQRDFVALPGWDVGLHGAIRTSMPGEAYLFRFCFASDRAAAFAHAEGNKFRITSAENGKEEQYRAEVAYGIVYLKAAPKQYRFDIHYVPLH